MTDKHDFDRDPLARQLRDSLAAHAADAPSGDLVAERVIHAAERGPGAAPRQTRRGWRTWGLPLVAAGAVAGVVAAVIGIENYHPSASPPAGSPGVSVLPSPLASTSNGVTTSAPSPTTVPNAADLTGVKIVNLTFVGDEGWALATADCNHGSGTCTALLHTIDGTVWTSMAGAGFNVPGVSAGCSYRCVQNIRFATPDVGYAFGPKAFLMTTDGGASWTQQDGGAIQLETLRGNVIRVLASSPSGCPGPCDVRVETSAIGSTTWAPSTLSTGTVNAAGKVHLSRGDDDAYLLVPANPTGGGIGTSTLYRSTDDGRTWINAGEPCRQTGQEVDSYAVAASPGGRASVLCANRQAPRHWFVATSTDHGATFTPQPGRVRAATASLLTGDPTTVLVTAGSGLARSTNGGKTWQPVAGVTGTVTFVGFESQTVGRAVTDNRLIWTTTDGGKTWTSAPFR